MPQQHVRSLRLVQNVVGLAERRRDTIIVMRPAQNLRLAQDAVIRRARSLVIAIALRHVLHCRLAQDVARQRVNWQVTIIQPQPVPLQKHVLSVELQVDLNLDTAIVLQLARSLRLAAHVVRQVVPL